MGIDATSIRVNDDGEPKNSAGIPIYGQIQSFGLTNVLIVSVRYFGGIKLGVGGLINAYKNSAKFAIESSKIIQKTIDVCFELFFDYELLGKVMKIIRENHLNIQSKKFEMDCQLIVEVRKSNAQKILKIFNELHKVTIHVSQV